MTNQQKMWLDAHPEYSPFGVPGGMVVYRHRGLLRPDGTFHLGRTQPKPAIDPDGTFAVGMREVRESGTMGDPRQDFGGRKV